MQKPTNVPDTSPSNSKHRYRTHLPISVPDPGEIAQQRRRPKEINSVREAKQQISLALLPAQYNGDAPQAQPSFETTSSLGSHGGQAVVETDAWLPYQRFKGSNELDRLRAELGIFGDEETFSTEQSSLYTVRPATKISKSSDSLSGSLEKGRSIILSSRANGTELCPRPSRSEISPPPGLQKNPRRALSPQREHANVGSEPPPLGNYEVRRKNVQVLDNAPRIQQPPQNYSRRCSPQSSRPKRHAASDNRTRNLTNGLSSPKGRLTLQPSTHLTKPPSVHRVQYETVEGVNLKTRPRSAKGNRIGLSIPEIEARDIQKISDRAPEDPDEDGDHSIKQRHYARSPPPIGSAHDYVQSISPRPVADNHDHALIDRYSRATEDEMPDQRAEVPSRYRLSLVAPFTKHDPPESDEDAESADGDSAAEPPSIARTRAFERQDQEMGSRTYQAKRLIGGMLKGLTGRKDDNQTGNYTAVRDAAARTTGERPVENGYAHDELSYLYDDKDYVDDNHHDNSVWSPNEMRRSVDTVVLRGHTPDREATR